MTRRRTSTGRQAPAIKVIASKIKVELETDEIKPKIAGLKFSYVVHFPGDNLSSSHKMAEIKGGRLNVGATIEGVTNPDKIPVRFTLDPLLDTGGHDHLDKVTDKARQAFGGFIEKGKPKIQFDGITNGKGTLKAQFQPENLNDAHSSSAAGFVGINATTTEKRMEKLTDSQQLTIRISGLVPLLDPAGNAYDLIGTAPEHPDNHYGTTSVVFALNEIANDYHKSHTAQILGYNDMSLVFGGLFDAYNAAKKPNTEWQKPHASHGCGTDIDVRPVSIVTPPTKPKDINGPDLAKAVSDSYLGAFMIEEEKGKTNHHFHIHFEDCS